MAQAILSFRSEMADFGRSLIRLNDRYESLAKQAFTR
jgi:hypothetical protein